MRITSEATGAVQVIAPRIRDEIDHFGDNVDGFLELALPLVDAAGSRVVIDLESSTYCDGLVSASVKLHHRARERGARVVFARPDAELLRGLQICKLDGFLDIYPSIESAILAIDPPGRHAGIRPPKPSS